MPKKRNLSRPSACASCSGDHLVRRITTYPVMLTGQLEGRQIDIGRVAMYQCQACGHMMPTSAGQAKVDKLVPQGIELFMGTLRRPG